MKMTHLSMVAVACGALTLSACADETVAPEQTPEVAQFGQVADAPVSL